MIPVVYAVNSYYYPYLYISIYSLIKNSTNNYDINILHNSLNENEINTLMALKNNKININIINIDEYVKDKRYILSDHISKEAYFRFLIPRILSNYNKVIYLDCDTIITKDLEELYNINLKNNTLGAVLDCGISSIKGYTSNIVKIPDNTYINSGVMLIDNKRFIQNEKEEKECLKIIIDNKKLKFHDQDIINIYYKNKILFLDSRWNKQIDLRIKKGFMNDIDNSFIIHYYGPSKAWLNKTNPNAYLFWKYAEETPLYDMILNDYLHYKKDSKLKKAIKIVNDNIKNHKVRKSSYEKN